MAKKTRLGDREFATRKDAAAAVRFVLHSAPAFTRDEVAHGDATPFGEPHHAMLSDLFDMHPDSDDKTGGLPIAGFFVEEHWNSRGFVVRLADGSVVDFSYKKCFSPGTARGRLKKACRRAVMPSVLIAKSEALPDDADPSAWHLDHLPPWPFARIFDEWLGDADPAEFVLTGAPDGRGRVLADTAVADAFVEFHDARAEYALVEPAENLRAGAHGYQRRTPMTDSYLSASRIALFEQCPRAYAFRYVSKTLSAGPRDNLEFGSVNHHALEDACEAMLRKEYRGEVPLDRLLLLYRRKFAASTLSGLEWYETGERIMRTWAAHVGTIEPGVHVAIEAKFDFATSAGTRLFGFVDRIDKVGPGHYRVLDYKTSRSVKSREDLAHDVQLAMYDLAARHLYPDAEVVDLTLHYLRHDVEVTVRRTDAQREALVGYLAAIRDRLDSETQWAPKVSVLCGWCDHRARCDAYLDATQGRTSYPVELEDVDLLVAEREAVALGVKMGKQRQAELDDAIKARIEAHGECTGAGRRFFFGERASWSYDTAEAIAVLEKADASTDVLTVDGRRLKSAITAYGKEHGKAKAMLLEAEVQAVAGRRRVTQYLRGEDADQ